MLFGSHNTRICYIMFCHKMKENTVFACNTCARLFRSLSVMVVKISGNLCKEWPSPRHGVQP